MKHSNSKVTSDKNEAVQGWRERYRQQTRSHLQELQEQEFYDESYEGEDVEVTVNIELNGDQDGFVRRRSCLIN